jgi:hypothetical protein
MHHFGKPLVENPSDFGLNTPRPMHHELLDLLAIQFIESGFHTKALHRFIMSSDTYRLSSIIPVSKKFNEQTLADPDNSLLWHANRRRLDLEQMRDTLLSISGQLDPTMFGRPMLIEDPLNQRRTIYSFVERQNLPNVVQIFDSANADSSTAKRPNTTVAQQALFAMNSPFMETISKSLAKRLDATTPKEKAILLYRLALGRQPTPNELMLGLKYTADHSWQDYAQILLMSNELWFID